SAGGAGGCPPSAGGTCSSRADRAVSTAAAATASGRPARVVVRADVRGVVTMGAIVPHPPVGCPTDPAAGQDGPMSEDPRPVPPGRVRRAARATGRGTSTAVRGTVRLARRASRAEGAGDSGLSRLIELHAVNAAGD